jgi:predicted DCC family thiol-disulfide oxidoreductase YuxK
MGATNPLEHKKIILFDGLCNLCNGSVQFIIKRDSKNLFRFSSLQSAFGSKQLSGFGLSANELYSIILINKGTYLQKSDAALEIAKNLQQPWPLLYAFKIVPRFFRDWIYDLIAKNRYLWFGKKDSCMIPTQELKSRFIE